MRAALLSAALLASTLGAEGPAAPGSTALTGTLPAGSTYVIRPMSGSTVASIALWYRTPWDGFGSDRAPGLGRVAAAAVAASKPIAGLPLARYVESIGGRVGVTSYPDSVAISLLVPADRATEAVRVLTRAYFAPVLDDSGLTLAKRELAGESALRRLTPDIAIGEALYARLFAASVPAASPALGSPTDLGTIALPRVRAYADRAFRPNNAVLVLTGAVSSTTIATASAGREGAAASSEPAVPEALAGPTTDAVALDGTDAGFGLAWAGPPIADERAATAFDMIADYLFRPDSGTVQRALRGNAVTLTGTFVTYHDPGVFYLTASGGDLKAARAAVDAAIASIQQPLSSQAFEAARAAFVYHVRSDQQTAPELADTYGWYAVEGNAAYAPGEGGLGGPYFTAAASLTPDFVAQAARAVFSHAPIAVTVRPAKAVTK